MPVGERTAKLEKTGCSGERLVTECFSSMARWTRRWISNSSVVRQSAADGSGFGFFLAGMIGFGDELDTFWKPI